MHNSWLPDSVYGTAALACLSQPCQAQNVPSSRLPFMMAAPDESKQQKISLYSAKYYQACTIGGILACGNPSSTASHCFYYRTMDSEYSSLDATLCLERRTHAYQRHALGRREMQYANRQQALQQHRHWIQDHFSRRRHIQLAAWLGADLYWLQHTRSWQIWSLRVF